MSTQFQNANKIKFMPLPYIGMYDLDVIYQSSDAELLYQVLYKINEIAQSQNIIIDNFEKVVEWAQTQIETFTSEQLKQWLEDGTLSELINMAIDLNNLYLVQNISEMTDHSKLYVLASDGYVYQWNGEEFTSTGLLFTSLIDGISTVYVNTMNYETVLPDLNTATKNTLYQIFLTSNSTPDNFPVTLTDERGRYLLFNFDNTKNGNYQILIDVNGTMYYRQYSGNILWTEWNTSELSNNFRYTITAANYNTYLPDVNNINSSVNYNLLFAKGSTSIPANLPFTAMPQSADSLMLINYVTQRYEGSIQLLIGEGVLYWRTRINQTTYREWVNLLSQNISNIYITANDGSLLRACLNNTGANIYVNCDIDVLTEFKSVYGDDFFENYNDDYYRDVYKRGIPLQNNMFFNAKYSVTCNYTGDNVSVINKFSAFNSVKSFYLKGLTLLSNNVRYGIHDDYDPGGYIERTYENCNITHTGSYQRCIGGGLATSTLINIKDCIFNTTDGEYAVTYHNNVNVGSSFLSITNCYFINGSIRISYYGDYDKQSYVLVSNNRVTLPIKKSAEGTATIDNITLYEFNNEVVS